MRKCVSMLMVVAVVASLCGGCVSKETVKETEETTTDEPVEPMKVQRGDVEIVDVGNFSLDFPETEEGYGIRIQSVGGPESLLQNEKPAVVNVRNKGAGFIARRIEAAYYAIEELSPDSSVICRARVVTPNGSAIDIVDTYRIGGNHSLILERSIEVIAQGGNDAGFQTVFSIGTPDTTKTKEDYDYFVPSIIYKDTSNMVSNAIFANLSPERVYVKETRTGLPLAMFRNKETTYGVAIAHLNPYITVNGQKDAGQDGEINSLLQYGSIGFKTKEGIAAEFCYPSYEGPVVYYSSKSRCSVYHPIEKGTQQNYSLGITPILSGEYQEAMNFAYIESYYMDEYDIVDNIDIDEIYDETIKVFDETYRRYGRGDTIAAGVPWSIDLKTGNSVEYSFQMGFVGQQTSVGYNLLRSGYEQDSDDLKSQGKAILDFWTSEAIMGDALPIVWWDPIDDSAGGRKRNYPSFLRCFIDGMEGVFDAYRYMYLRGEDEEQWKAALLKVGNFLIENQNEDGSYYRAYNTDGTVCTDTSVAAYQGTSKLNTPVAIRFLAKMYEMTGDERYKEAVRKAADFSYDELFVKLGKYVGGTPDNPNTVDKEAAIYALYGFNAACQLFDDEYRYREAARHAAISALSWVYAYDFACPSGVDNAKINPFEEGRISGFSIIATGHSAADNYAASMYYELYKIYVRSEELFFRDAALFIQNNTKQSMDYDGSMGFRYKAIGPEASNVSDFSFGTVGVWLPWSGIVNIKPMTYMRDTFGNADIRKVEAPIEELREKLDEYGVGGKLD